MMNQYRSLFALAALVLGGLMASPALAADLDATIESCARCHGAKGVSTHADVPTIAGISAAAHEDAWFTYQDKARPCQSMKTDCGSCADAAETDMCKIAAELGEQDIVAIAAHFADLPFVAVKQDFDAARATAGAAIHERECSRCHSDGGANAEDDAGILAGQPMAYLKRSFAEFGSGEREQPKKMKPKMDALTADDTEALLHYYASQQ